METENKICGNCIACIKTCYGCSCNLTDNDVDYDDEACIDYIAEDEKPNYE